MSQAVTRYAVVDEVEDDLRVLVFDDGPKVTVKAAFLPPGADEGKVLKCTIEIDEAERGRRREEIVSLQEKLLARTRGEKK